ncbi:alkane hydroxylase MAH1-like [Quercus robur]|uniref:alkane hydroxylase MAH1-like n=1 Tax=Quercus robur TaxID=38942 RepID=UPI002163614F|nr:alkane hydroxylase MAH1-like [Quercus robur]
MVTLLYPEMVVAILSFLCFLFLCQWRWNKTSPITNWPILGMFPDLFFNVSHVHDYATSLLKHYGGTFEFKGPWLARMDAILTSDPMNIQHILSKNFSNYDKGPTFREIFEPMGDGIFSTDSETWRYQRKLIQSLIKHSKFMLFLEKVVKGKVEKGLIPVLDHVSSLGIEVDLQDVFQRFTFDNVCLMVLGFDSNCLTIEFPEVAHAKAFDQMEESLLYRHILPRKCWKFQRWVQIGREKKLSSAWKTFDQFVYGCISSKREKLSRGRALKMEEAEFDLLTAIEQQEREMNGIASSNKFLRDTAFNLIAAGRDTISAGLTWILWLVATHPSVEAKILEEIKAHLLDEVWRVLGIDELSKLVYLHGAICESLRLFPPIPFDHKCAVQADILPSGHHIRSNMRLIYSLYSMGRMESIWGEDCLEFKPERWISEQGGIVHVPSFKFIAFNAGARTCLGKDISFTQMKMITTAIIWNYHIHVVEGHPISPRISVVLHMKHGLKVRLSKRNV